MGDLTRRWRQILIVATSAVALLGAFAPGATALESKSASVDSKQVWTSTDVHVRAGQRVAITAAGHVHFGLRPIDAVAPAGLPWPGCTRVAGSRLDAWPAPGIACWSLLARVDRGPVVPIGAGRTITADHDGILQLGVNDNELSDNRGTWSATIVVVPPPRAGGGSSPMPLLFAIAAVVLLTLLVFVVLARRLRRRAPQLADEAQTALAVPAFELPTTAVSPGDEDVNIYEVELRDDELRVGYSYFPEGVVVRWRIVADDGVNSGGEFTTRGGPDRHGLRFRVDQHVARAARAEITFEWTVGDAPFAYAVTRRRLAEAQPADSCRNSPERAETS